MTDSADTTNQQAGPGTGASFDTLYRPMLKDVFSSLVNDEIERGADPDERAQEYAERGKTDFTLAYLLVSARGDEQKREVFAYAWEQHARYIERQAREFDARFHRPFPLLQTEAAKDRAIARLIHAGRPVRRGIGRQLPQL